MSTWPPTTHQDVQDAVTALLTAVPAPTTGAVAAARFAGGTAVGAPASGTFAVGDFVVDESGTFWICTVAGSPGIWVQAGSATYLALAAPQSALVASVQTTTSVTFTDLATVGPQVTVTIGSSGRALVALSCDIGNLTATGTSLMGFAVSGVTTVAATTTQCLSFTAPIAGNDQVVGNAFMVTGLTPGSNVFTAKYRTITGATGQYAQRAITVMPL